MKLFLAALFLVFSSTSADTATQSDWSGGPGVWGPVTGFGSQFYMCSGIEISSTSDGLVLDLIDQIMRTDVVVGFDAVTGARGADIDLDGDMDVVGCAYIDYRISWFENLDGAGKSWLEHVVDSLYIHAVSICPADIDGDGYADIVGCQTSSEERVRWWKNPAGLGETWEEHTVEFATAHEVCCDDIDGDGDMDILRGRSSETENDMVAWLENVDGAGTSWAKHVIDSSNMSCDCVHSTDIDGDGDMDVVGEDGTPPVAWWENLDGVGTSWAEHIVAIDFPSFEDVCSADMDGDGDMDILGASSATGILWEMSWWENLDGAGTSWTRHVICGSFWGAHSIWAADMDEDGDMDILGAAEYEGTFSWWENLNGLGTSLEEHLFDNSLGYPWTVCAADIDGDGILDAIGSAYWSDCIVWWDLLTNAPEGWLISSVLDVSCGPDWGSLDWTAEVPAGTSLGFQVRSSSSPDSASMGPWSDTLYAPCSLHGILPDWEQYFQYKVILRRTAEEVSPALQSMTVTWNPLGLEGGSEPSSFQLLPVSPNPATGTVTVCFVLPEPTSVEISVFDLSGRLVRSAGPGEYEPGTTQVQLGEFGSGIYLVRMRTGDFEDTRRFAVIE